MNTRLQQPAGVGYGHINGGIRPVTQAGGVDANPPRTAQPHQRGTFHLYRGSIIGHQPQTTAMDQPLLQNKPIMEAVAGLFPFQNGIGEQEKRQSRVPDRGQRDINRVSRPEKGAQYGDEQKRNPFFSVV